MRELTYRFELQLDSSPERLWPLVSDTNRFNRDVRVPPVEELGVAGNARRRLRLTRFGVAVEWEEEPFEWVSPHRFSVVRRYARGPVAWMRTAATLEPRTGGGTTLVYEVRALPRRLVGVALERTAWRDNAATAAEVTALQAYRDLFAAEALRAGEPISVGTLTVVFTDLRGSTRYYRETGDAPAFGIHTGPCIAVSQNGVLDYFGSTVNLAARLVSLSSGEDIVVSDAVLADPEVAALGLRAEALEGGVLKGLEDDALSLCRVSE